MCATRTDSGAAVESESDPESTERALSETTIDALPPSAKLVYKVLEYEGAMTQEEIALESRLCARTVRHAVGKLEEQGVVTSRVNLEDARQSIYRIAD